MSTLIPRKWKKGYHKSYEAQGKSRTNWDSKQMVERVGEYQKEFRITKTLRFNKVYDEDILKFIETKKPLTTYIKELIREDMRKQGLQDGWIYFPEESDK